MSGRERMWKPWPGGECPHCGGALEIETEAIDDGYGYDGERLRCSECHCPGQLQVDGPEEVDEEMHDELNCSCEWCVLHPVNVSECPACIERRGEGGAA